MALTLNQIIQRIRSLSLSHRQVNSFYFGDVHEFDANGDITYPGVFLEQQPGSIDRVAKQLRYNFRLFCLDLVNVSEQTEGNETDVLSDMHGVAIDIVSMMMNAFYQDDWMIVDTAVVLPVTESLGDMVAGAVLEIGVLVDFIADSCVVPGDDVEFEQTFDMAKTKIYPYTADGTEGDSFAVAFLSGKPVLAVWRAGYYKRAVHVAPTDDEKIQVGTTDLGSGNGILSNGTVTLMTGDALIVNEKVDFLYYGI